MSIFRAGWIVIGNDALPRSIQTMTTPFSPPKSHVADVVVQKPANWALTLFMVAMFSLVSLGLSWVVAPLAAGSLALLLGINGEQTPPAFLLIDLILSGLAFVLGCYGAARLSRGHSRFALAGVAVIGWLVYFVEVGGIQGMLHSQYPWWYEFFPDHFCAAVVAAYFVRRR